MFATTAFDRLLDDVMGTSLGTATNRRTFVPDIDIFARDGQVEFVCDLPGVRREDLDLTVEGRVLTIKGLRKFDGDKGKDAQVVLGRSYGSFSRSFNLPNDLDTENLSAELADGVLTLRIPKHEKAKARKIAIHGPVTEKKLGE
jgi:HSP20 family protein